MTAFLITLPVIYLSFVLSHAALDVHLVRQFDVKINHFKEAIIFALVCAVFFVLIVAFTDAPFLPFIILPFLTRVAWFDPFYNWNMGRRFLYEGDPDKRDSEKSWWDKLEDRLRFPTVVYRVFYFALWTGYVIFYYFKYF